MQKPTLLLLGNYGAGNWGDEAILKGLIQDLSPHYNLIAVSGDPKSTRAQQGIEAVHFWPSGIRSFGRAHWTQKGRIALEATRGAFKKADIVALGGGTLLTDEPFRALWIWRCQLKPAQKLGKKIWLYRGGIGPLNQARSRQWVQSWLKTMDRVVVRDLKSAEWAKRLGRETVEQSHDPALDLRGGEFSDSPKTGVVLMALRSWAKNENELISAIKKLVRYLKEKEGKIVKGILFEKGCKKDIELMNKTFEQYEDPSSLEALLNLMKSADHVVGMRLHSLILADLVKTPYTGIVYSEKVAGFLESRDRANHGISLEKITFESLLAAYKRSANDRS